MYKWFDHLKKQGHHISSYVIMPNHIFATIAFRHNQKNINTIVGDGKRFMGYEIMNRLKSQGRNDLLQQMTNTLTISDKMKSKVYELWEDSFDWNECDGDKFMYRSLIICTAIRVQASGNWRLML